MVDYSTIIVLVKNYRIKESSVKELRTFSSGAIWRFRHVCMKCKLLFIICMTLETILCYVTYSVVPVNFVICVISVYCTDLIIRYSIV